MISGGPFGLFFVLSEPLSGPPGPPSNRHSEGRAFLGTANARRIHVQRRSERAVLPAVGSAKDGRVAESEFEILMCLFLRKISFFEKMYP